MEHYNQEQTGFIASLGGWNKIAWCTLACVIANLLLTLITFLAIFSTLNPDKEAWAGSIEISEAADGGPRLLYTLYSEKAQGEEANASNLIDVHGRFVTWFSCGFLLSMTPLPIAITSLCIYICHNRVGIFVAYVYGCTVGCGFVAWWVLGLCWRFSELGIYVSGEKNESSTEEDEIVNEDATKSDIVWD